MALDLHFCGFLVSVKNRHLFSAKKQEIWFLLEKASLCLFLCCALMIMFLVAFLLSTGSRYYLELAPILDTSFLILCCLAVAIIVLSALRKFKFEDF
jgi:hypothetical protein